LAAGRDGGVVGSQILLEIHPKHRPEIGGKLAPQNMADMARKKKEFHGDNHGKNSNFDLN